MPLAKIATGACEKIVRSLFWFYMKIILAIFVALLALGAGGYFVYNNLSSTSQPPAGNYKTSAVTLTGILQPAKGDDYSYLLISNGKSTGVASQKIDLNQYAGKKVSVSGQYSGTTLYADEITIMQ